MIKSYMASNGKICSKHFPKSVFELYIRRTFKRQNTASILSILIFSLVI